MYAKTNANGMSNVSGGGDDDDNDWEFKLRREMSMALLSALLFLENVLASSL